MLPSSETDTSEGISRLGPASSEIPGQNATPNKAQRQWKNSMSYLSRKTYQGSLAFNFFAFLFPALYGTLVKFWVANIDPSQVVTTDIYTYIGVIVEVLNDGLPRSAWLIIGDKSTRTLSSRLEISYTLILIQTILGAVMMVIFVASSERLAAAFVPAQVRDASINYVQISSVSALSSALQVSVSNCTRALDNPDVPLLIATVTVIVNIVLDLLIISKFHVGSWTPTIIDQALIRMACDITAALVGLAYFAYIARRLRRQSPDRSAIDWRRSGIVAIKILAPPSAYTFVESALRNALYLWLVTQIVSLGETYSTAWGVFNTIRWGLVMVPVQALESSTLAFVGHNWGQWRARVGANLTRAKATRRDILSKVPKSALLESVPLTITQNIDWCYIFYALNYQLSAILLATNPRWFLYQALGSNLLWVLPWAIVVTKVKMTQEHAWTFYSIIFGGSLVFSFLVVAVVLLFWASRLMKGKIVLPRLEKVAP
ncbi:MAG: hypothetical protein Q9201_004040 [Fulgogasparrea decipioides]